MNARRPRPERQGGTIETPKDAVSQVVEGLNAFKASINDQWSTLLHQATEARIEVERLRSELARVTQERDEARAALKPKAATPLEQFKSAEALGQMPLLAVGGEQ